MKNKIFNLCLFVSLGIQLPLLGKFHLLSDPRILILFLFSGWLIFSQPEFKIKQDETKNRGDKKSLELIFVSSLLSIAITLIDWAYFHFLPVKVANLFLGLIFMLSGLLFRIWAIKTLGKFFTTRVEFKKDHKLITVGPYKYFRHPSYTGAFIVFLGVPFIFGSVVGLILTFLCMIIAYKHRINAEEKVLKQGFGQHYEKYMESTFGLVPGI